MLDRKTLKTRAKAVLSRSYFQTLLACVIVNVIASGGISVGINRLRGIDFSAMSLTKTIMICTVVAMLLVVGLLVNIFIVNPLTVGLKKFLTESAKGEIRLENLLFPFKNGYKGIVICTFVKNLYIFLWMLLGFIPFAIAVFGFGYVDRIIEFSQLINGGSTSAIFKLVFMSMGMIIITGIFMIPAIIKSLQYAMTEYILSDNPYVGTKAAISQSKEMMVGYKWEYLKLELSFLGWYLLANAVCCIGTLAIDPYFHATLTELYFEISGKKPSVDNDINSGFGW